MYRNIIRVKVM